MRPGVIFGGPSPEHDVSVITGLMAARTLVDAGHDVQCLYWSKPAEFFAVDSDLEAKDFVDGVPRRARPLKLIAALDGGFVPEGGGLGRKKSLSLDAVVNCCHGGPGEDGTLQAALDLAGIRYTGPSVAGAALGMDKLAFASAVVAAGLPHVPCIAIGASSPDEQPFDGPFIVKPRFGGSSIGIEILEDWKSALAFVRSPQPNLRAGAVVEPYLSGAHDLEIGIRTHPSLELSAISKPLRAGEGDAIYDYRGKYVGAEGMSSAPRELPAELPDGMEATIREAATAVASIAAVRGVARLDFLLRRDDLYLNEINTIPGSLSKHLWIDPEVPFATLLSDLLAEATAGPARQYSTQGADGSALRAAGAIGGKLG